MRKRIGEISRNFTKGSRKKKVFATKKRTFFAASLNLAELKAKSTTKKSISVSPYPDPSMEPLPDPIRDFIPNIF